MKTVHLNKATIITLLVKKRWIWHVAFWSFYFTLESVNYIFPEDQVIDIFKLGLIIDINVFLMTYSIILIIFPLFFDKKKYIFFVFFVLLNAFLFSIIIGYLVRELINDFIITFAKSPPITLLQSVLQHLSLTILFSMFIVMSKTVKQIFVNQYYDNEKRKMQMQSELNNLKAQLSPHFLFNTMNNFYGLAVEKSNKLPDLMLRLSDLMRYSLYETKNENVNLVKEVDFLLNYIELEKIRLEDSLKLAFNVDKEKIKNYEIAPLLLIVFVENAFKHSRNTNNNPIDIKINLIIDKNNFLNFTIENNYTNIESKSTTNNDGGIGIENVKKRLLVLYPNDYHHLEIKDLNGHFKVQLSIKLFQKHS